MHIQSMSQQPMPCTQGTPCGDTSFLGPDFHGEHCSGAKIDFFFNEGMK